MDVWGSKFIFNSPFALEKLLRDEVSDKGLDVVKSTNILVLSTELFHENESSFFINRVAPVSRQTVCTRRAKVVQFQLRVLIVSDGEAIGNSDGLRMNFLGIPMPKSQGFESFLRKIRFIPNIRD